MSIPLFDFQAVNEYLLDEYLEEVKELFAANNFVLGTRVQQFEERFAKYIGSKHAVGVNSGTDAIYLSLLGLGIGPGDEVICPAFSFANAAHAVMRAGATPVFVDVREETYNLNPDMALASITSKTKAIVMTHLFGQAGDVDRLSTIARTYSVSVIEDCSHAAGARYNNRRVGTFGVVSCFSFHPTRTLGAAGDGGMILTGDEVLSEHLRKMRNHGRVHGRVHDLIGINSRLDALQAALLSLKLQELDENNTDRIENARLYTQLFTGTVVQPPHFRDDFGHVYNLYTILAPERDKLIEHLHEKGIGSGIYYPMPLHLQPCFSSLNYKQGAFPISESLCNRCLSIPVGPGLKKHHVEEIASAVLDFYGAGVE